MRFKNAIVRKPAMNFSNGITSGILGKPDYGLALRQHTGYCRTLEACGLKVSILEADEQHPDSTFVEDVAVLTQELAVITRPGAASRLGEIDTIRPALSSHFETIYNIDPPGTMDGGDICQAESHFFIGISERTNQAGAEQLATFVKRHGYSSTLVDCRNIPGLLHLKSGIAYLGENIMVMVRSLDHHPAFIKYEHLLVEAQEEYAANCIRVNEWVLVASGFPLFKEQLERKGVQPISLEVSEFQKMDGGLSCLSLRF